MPNINKCFVTIYDYDKRQDKPNIVYLCIYLIKYFIFVL